MASSKCYLPIRSELDARTEKELVLSLAQLAETAHFTKAFDPQLHHLARAHRSSDEGVIPQKFPGATPG